MFKTESPANDKRLSGINDWHLIGERISGYFQRNENGQGLLESIFLYFIFMSGQSMQKLLDKESCDSHLC